MFNIDVFPSRPWARICIVPAIFKSLNLQCSLTTCMIHLNRQLCKYALIKKQTQVTECFWCRCVEKGNGNPGEYCFTWGNSRFRKKNTKKQKTKKSFIGGLQCSEGPFWPIIRACRGSPTIWYLKLKLKLFHDHNRVFCLGHHVGHFCVTNLVTALIQDMSTWTDSTHFYNCISKLRCSYCTMWREGGGGGGGGEPPSHPPPQEPRTAKDSMVADLHQKVASSNPTWTKLNGAI